MVLDPILLEYAFSRLSGDEIGKRGTLHDADIFRHGTIKDLGNVLEEAADSLKKRVDGLPFTDAEKANGGPEPRLRDNIEKLYRISQMLKERDEKDDIGYHWEVIGCFVDSLAASLEMIESRI